MKPLSDKDQALIIKYLHDDLTASEQSEFEDRLANETFRKEALSQADLVDALIHNDSIKLIEQLQAIEPSQENESQNVKSKANRWPFILLTFVLLGLLGLWIGSQIGKDDTVNYRELAMTYSTPYPPTTVQRGTAVVDKEMVNKVMSHYANESYQLVINELKSIEPKTDLLKLYEANAYIQLQKFGPAKILLSQLIQSEESELKQNAEWYDAIAHLGANDVIKAKSQLKLIAGTKGHLFKSKAVALLQELLKE